MDPDRRSRGIPSKATSWPDRQFQAVKSISDKLVTWCYAWLSLRAADGLALLTRAARCGRTRLKAASSSDLTFSLLATPIQLPPKSMKPNRRVSMTPPTPVQLISANQVDIKNSRTDGAGGQQTRADHSSSSQLDGLMLVLRLPLMGERATWMASC